ncbi:MAG: PAS domain-containing protein, partial [Alphaproteobacteria bacterium]|nr:PAS domain-containing protein [Alphaproteobacteria bacterium]
GGRSLLVRPDGDAVGFIAADPATPPQHRPAALTAERAAAFAIAAPGGFAVRRDAAGEPVLVTGRAVPGTPWSLVYEVKRDVALAESDRRLAHLAVFLGLSVAILAGTLVAVWYHASARHASAAAAAFEAMARRLENQSQLLRLVTDSQPNAVFIADERGRYGFANREAERRTGLAESDLIGKSVEAVLGPAAASRCRRRNEAALRTGRRVDAVDRIDEDGETRVFKTAHVPLAGGPERKRGVLVVEEELTPLFAERERRERGLQQLIRAMSAAVDRRDSFAADQSRQVAAIARAIAEEMGLDPSLAETAETAGNLVNFGKLLVPAELLGKAERLSAAEIAMIRSALQATADFIADTAFDGPVVATLRHIQERWDGSGPNGVAGEAIGLAARIVAVANAFVAIATPRAWRAGSDVDCALTQLLAQIGTSFDRRIVAALVSWFDNRGGRAHWSALLAAPAYGRVAHGRVARRGEMAHISAHVRQALR